MTMADPVAHRRLIGKVFSPSTMKEQRGRVERIVGDALTRRREMEVMGEFAKVVPVQVICGMLGVPHADWDLLTSWTPDMFRMFAPDANDAEEIRLCQQTCQNFFGYFGSVIDDRQHGKDSVADPVPTRDGAAGGADDRLFPSAIEEFLRWKAPVHTQIRHPTVDLELYGTTINAGEPVWVLMGSANRDKCRFADPASADVGRTEVAHHSFGGGAHFCLGAPLARLGRGSPWEGS